MNAASTPNEGTYQDRGRGISESRERAGSAWVPRAKARAAGTRPLPRQLVEAVERVVHLDVPDLREAGLGGQVAQRRLGQPEGAQALAALGQGGGHAVQDRESVQQRGDGAYIVGGLVRAVDLQAEVRAAGPQRVPDRAEQ